jgi:N utilization substance protein B
MPAPAPPEPKLRPRTLGRLAAVQALYQIEQNQAPAEAVIDEFIRHRLDERSRDVADGGAHGAAVPLFAGIVRGWARNADALDGAIVSLLAEGWPMARLDPVLRALLRAAASELFAADGAPARVVIDEYMNVAHAFFGAEEPRFANGVLDRLARRLRAAEFATP